MIPAKGQFIQVRFNNGIFLDGVVQEWTDQKSILQLTDNNDTVIIQKTLQDVLLVRIFSQNPKQRQEKQQKLSDTFELLKDQPKTPETLTTMAELKDELNKIEREEILKQVRSNKFNNTKEVIYGLPRNLNIASPPQYPTQEAPTENSDFNSELQRVFAQKH